MTRRFLNGFMILAVLMASVACEKTKVIDSAEALLSSIQVSAAKDNALRYYADMNFTAPCSFKAEYWETSDPSSVRNTRTFESDGTTGRLPIMFVKANTSYTFKVTVSYEGKDYTTKDSFEFTTKSLPLGVPEYTVDESFPHDLKLPGYILHGQASSPTGYLVFTDTDGNVVWYQDFDEAVRHFYFDQKSRTIVVLTGFKNSLSDVKFQRFCNNYIRIDLEGNILEAWKTSPSNIEYPHHDIKVDADGNLVILHGVSRNYDLTPIGGGSSVDVFHDGFTVIGPDGTKLFTWDTSDTVDPVNDKYLNTLDTYYDLVHANSVSWDEAGDYYFTLNNLNELWKIDGKTGKVLYRVGDNGNIDIPADAHTSGIHSSVPLAPDKVLVFDNGSKSGISRALVYDINASAKTASVSLSVPIPSSLSSTDRSNCELLEDEGLIFFGSTAGRCCLFTDMDGNIRKVIRRSGVSYRTHYFSSIEY